MLIAAPKDVMPLNFFFDTLLFCGTIVLFGKRDGQRDSCGAGLMRINIVSLTRLTPG